MALLGEGGREAGSSEACVLDTLPMVWPTGKRLSQFVEDARNTE